MKSSTDVDEPNFDRPWINTTLPERAKLRIVKRTAGALKVRLGLGDHYQADLNTERRRKQNGFRQASESGVGGSGAIWGHALKVPLGL